MEKLGSFAVLIPAQKVDPNHELKVTSEVIEGTKPAK
jgi:hypothetical protein